MNEDVLLDQYNPNKKKIEEDNDMIDSTKDNIKWIVPIKGREDKYLITNTGAVWSKDKKMWMKLQIDESRHFQIDLQNNYQPLIHRLVYQHFVGPIPEGFIIHHLDNDPQNNWYLNLVAMTRSEHARLHKKGSKHTQQTKKKMSESMKGIKRSQQTKKRMSEAKKNMTQQTKKKISESRKGIKFSQEHKRKLSEAAKNRKCVKDPLTGRFMKGEKNERNNS